MNSLLLDLLDPREVVAYRPALARALNSPLAALFLCQACHWQAIVGVGKWFYKLRDARRGEDGKMLPPLTASEQSWEWETGMGRSAQQTARKILRDLGLMEESEWGIPNRLHFRINIEKLGEFLAQTQENRQLAESYQLEGRILPTGGQDLTNSMATSDQLEGRILPTNTETTSSISNKTTQSPPLPPASGGLSVRQRGTRTGRKKLDLNTSSEAFRAFWASYPKQIHLKESWEAWSADSLDAQASIIMEGLERWKKSQDWVRDDGRYVPAPDKWLEGMRWLDSPAEYKVGVIRNSTGRVVDHERGDVERDYGQAGAI